MSVLFLAVGCRMRCFDRSQARPFTATISINKATKVQFRLGETKRFILLRRTSLGTSSVILSMISSLCSGQKKIHVLLLLLHSSPLPHPFSQHEVRCQCGSPCSGGIFDATVELLICHHIPTASIGSGLSFSLPWLLLGSHPPPCIPSKE